ncbi:hypothetical protein ACOSQ3_024950 [Xanthoceras sorbifolium]
MKSSIHHMDEIPCDAWKWMHCFNQDGEIVYRIDNYEKKRSKEVYLMDLRGNVLFTLQKSNNNDKASCCYKLEALPGGGKSAFKIVDSQGGVVAEAKRKQSSSGLVLGDDVLTLIVEAHVDHSLVVALVTVYGLIHHML